MGAVAGPSGKQFILAAMHRLAGRGITEVGLPDLIYHVWEESPKTFGLKTKLIACPDSHKVICDLSGSNGLVKTGYLSRPRPSVYSLTPLGLQEANKMAAQNKPKKKQLRSLARLPADLDARLATALDSRAFFKFRLGLVADTSWDEALAFWGGAASAWTFGNFVGKLSDYVHDGDLSMAGGRIESEAAIMALGQCGDRLMAMYGRRLEKANVPGA